MDLKFKKKDIRKSFSKQRISFKMLSAGGDVWFLDHLPELELIGLGQKSLVWTHLAPVSHNILS